MAEVRPEREERAPEISREQVRKLIRKMSSDREKLDRAADEMESAGKH
jgi:hypothetical protein